jgi:hypothetical protein
MLESHGNLPADIRLPVERSSTCLEGRNVKGAARAAFKARAVQKDARIIDKSGGRDRVSVAVGFACIKKALRHCSFVELHVSGLDVDERLYHSLDVIVIDKVSTVTAAALHHVGCISVKHSLTAFTENAAVV